MLITCMKELEKDHADMLTAYESGDKERVEEADQTNNRVSLACMMPDNGILIRA